MVLDLLSPIPYKEVSQIQIDLFSGKTCHDNLNMRVEKNK